jgi:lipoate-protein ligase A
MKFLDITLPTIEENLALEEALLDECEESHRAETLRFWESPHHCVVVGHANRVAREVKMSRCRQWQIPVLRRRSGGGAVLQGPGCLNYALVLAIEEDGPLSTIARTNEFVLGRIRRTLEGLLGHPVTLEGGSDLCLDGRKFSGNAQRRRLHSLLYHGTILTRLDIELVEELLPMPTKEPPYRQGRAHRDFMTNVQLSAPALREAIRKEWNATEEFGAIPVERVREIVAERYALDSWNFRF